MTERFLIDGYNVLHALGLPKRLGPTGLQLARQRLLALIRQRFPDADITVVFDGTQASGLQNERGISVLFAKGEADDLIVHLIAHDSAPRSLCVVSSDHAIQTAAKRRRTEVQDADAFLRQLDRRAVPPPLPEPEKPPMDVETQHWLDAFGEIDRDPEVRRMQEIEPLGRRKMRRKKSSE